MQSLELSKAEKRKYIEQYFRKCLRIEGVQNAIVFNSLGVPKQSTFEKAETIRAIGLFDDLIFKVKRAIQLINTDDQFVSIRLRTQKFEIFISLDLNDIYFVIFQNVQGIWYPPWLDQILLWLKIHFSLYRHTQPITRKTNGIANRSMYINKLNQTPGCLTQIPLIE